MMWPQSPRPQFSGLWPRGRSSGGRSLPLKPTKVTLFKIILCNSKNSVCDIRWFCRPLFYHSNVVKCTSILLQQRSCCETWLPNITEIAHPNLTDWIHSCSGLRHGTGTRAPRFSLRRRCFSFFYFYFSPTNVCAACFKLSGPKRKAVEKLFALYDRLVAKINFEASVVDQRRVIFNLIRHRLSDDCDYLMTCPEGRTIKQYDLT